MDGRTMGEWMDGLMDDGRVDGWMDECWVDV